MNLEIGKNMKFQRKLRGWSQEDLAMELKLSRTMIEKYESGESIPPLKRAVQMCKLFEIDLADFSLKNMRTSSFSKSATHPLLPIQKIRLTKFVENHIPTIKPKEIINFIENVSGNVSVSKK